MLIGLDRSPTPRAALDSCDLVPGTERIAPMTDLETSVLHWVPMKTVLLCDPRPAVRTAVGWTLAGMPAGVEITCVADGFSLVDAYSAHHADLVLIGVRRGWPTGTDAVNLLLGLHPLATVIAYGSAQDTEAMSAAVARGARGLMLWDPDQLSARPKRPMPWAGHLDAPPGVARTELTEREMQVLLGMSQGQSNSEIGRELFLSEDTIKTHARRLFSKLGARDRAHAVALGMRHSLLT
jgi:DNA-binding NarL/FixJ family response regulator